MGSGVSAPAEFGYMTADEQKTYQERFQELVKGGATPEDAIKELTAESVAKKETSSQLAAGDQDKDGKLSKDELVKAAVAQGATEVQAEKEADRTMKRVDSNKDGLLSKEELEADAKKKWLDAFNQKLLKEFFSGYGAVKAAFAAADKDGGGSVSIAEFGEILRTSVGADISDAEIKASFAVADKDNDGKVNWVEFINALENDTTGAPPPPGPPPSAEQLAADRRANIDRGPAGLAGVLRAHISRKYRDIRQAFLKHDPDKNGFIDAKEVGTILKTMNFNASEEDLKMFVAGFPHESSSGFNYIEFVAMVEGQKPYKGMDIAA